MAAAAAPAASGEPNRVAVITALGLTQILAWGSSYYLLAVLAPVVAADTGWPLPWIVGGLSLGLMAAGFISPRVGRTIDERGGRPVLATSALLFAAGLCGLAAAPSLPLYLAAWIVLGLAMGAGLYDAAFATLGRLYGQGARQAITTLTLFGGFASTACWPLSAFLVSSLGWRGACLVYAGLHLAVALPLYLVTLPRVARTSRPCGPAGAAAGCETGAGRRERAVTGPFPSAGGDDYARLGGVGPDVGASPVDPAATRRPACRGGRPRRPGRAGAGRRPRHRNADRPLPSSDLDADGGDCPGGGRDRPALGRPAGHRGRAARLRRGDRHRVRSPGAPCRWRCSGPPATPR